MNARNQDAIHRLSELLGTWLRDDDVLRQDTVGVVQAFLTALRVPGETQGIQNGRALPGRLYAATRRQRGYPARRGPGVSPSPIISPRLPSGLGRLSETKSRARRVGHALFRLRFAATALAPEIGMRRHFLVQTHTIEDVLDRHHLTHADFADHLGLSRSYWRRS